MLASPPTVIYLTFPVFRRSSRPSPWTRRFGWQKYMKPAAAPMRDRAKSQGYTSGAAFQGSRPGPGPTNVELRDNGSALLQVRRSKTDPEGECVVLYIGNEADEALRAIRPVEELLDLNAPIFGLSVSQLNQRILAAAQVAGLGEGFTGHSGRVGMAQDLVKSGLELPALMTAGRWKRARRPARYTERQAADRGAVDRYYQEGEN